MENAGDVVLPVRGRPADLVRAVTAIASVRAHCAARKQQELVAEALTKAFLDVPGASVVLEYKVPDRGDGRGGRVDIVVLIPGWRPVAVEVDSLLPREKSLRKLELFDGWRIVALRTYPNWRPWMVLRRRVHAIIALSRTGPGTLLEDRFGLTDEDHSLA